LPAVPDRTAKETALDFDAVVIGAGVSGLYQLYRLRELGLRVRVFETGTGGGGTWYWNRYPGTRFDFESWTYGYSFSQDLLEEWDWEEYFAAQPETERYLNYVADKFDLRRDIQFGSGVTAAHYQEATRSWAVLLEDGRRYTTRLVITAIGVLSAETLPTIPGLETSREEVHGHTIDAQRTCVVAHKGPPALGLHACARPPISPLGQGTCGRYAERLAGRA
jgi:cation diffusion facilitator CzcD-associated flavoprotein CzcO